MLLIAVIFAIQMLSILINQTPVSHCEAQQQAFAARDPRIRHRGIAYATNQLGVNDQIATLNSTALLQQLPSRGYGGDISEKEYRPLYTLPQRATPPDVAKYRNYGNYFQPIPINAPTLKMLPPLAPPFKKERKRHTEYSTPVSFDHQVLHLDGQIAQEYRPRRYTNTSSDTARAHRRTQAINTPAAHAKPIEAQASILNATEGPRGSLENMEPAQTIKKTQSYHDIFMRFNGPHHLDYGHIELQPRKHFEKRFESLNKNNGNRHRGEIVWVDATGGYGEHHWDLAQGKLR
ncbi:uncharacterized protein LOC118747968 [Rhagoletis pomonella]|uniref:uncharacterized protein LOC118747968 n=1 Tax=Rhagoletis pomonella TaxID=28610 RepID=UPI001780B45B|nr:uncharacterized protein LOC118747968 [Rhagoletis pomonella]XP_036338102.1 uncharacterized protein LOC118747968 [Rhagoletis pomonella]XP_036338103.1 uncharacterized protein LOC118747968 [Rhagoletis pomonella]